MSGTMGLFSCIILSFFQFSLAIDTIKQGQSIKNTETLVSSGGNFELGFFSPSNSKNYYLGIWFKKIPLKTVVWVANRSSPLTSSSYLTIKNNGNLVIFDGLEIVTTLTFSISNGNTTATLLDSGNFVLKGDGNLDMLWQSFDYPTDTLLPGMKIGLNLMTGQAWSLISWKSMDDPNPGSFSLKLDSQALTQVSIWQGEVRYWSSGVWDGKIVSGPLNVLPIVNYTYITNNIESYFTYSMYNTSIIHIYFLDFSGLLKQSIWSEDLQQWKVLWYEPRQKCDVYGYCGAFAYCNQNTSVVCGCLHGFEPRSARDWNRSDWSGGCVRRTALQCGNTSNADGEKYKDGFSQIHNVKFPLNSTSLTVGSEEECKFACLNNCSCSAYAYGYRGCSMWDGDILNLVPLVDDHSAGGNLYLRLAASELPNSQGNTIPSSTEGKKTSFSDSGTIRLWLIVALPIVLVSLISIAFMCHLWIIKLNRKEKQKSQDLLLFDLAIGIKATNSEQVDNNVGKGGTNDVELPLFSFASIIASTDNFSATNKLGEGGFGPVYKGKLLRGQEVAVKRLSRKSGQGLEEFKNETTLIAKLQHRNLVRILGCCIEDGENILIYEYMSNKSLDCFLFDPTKRELLDWTRRIHIIEGIAQGLLYLHQYSRVRIIHRDLKASNILLDGDMNPKISDFGLARIFGGNESHANTKRIVGTYGYMSPEYANRGHFSIKSDVYSFGVLLLEILSGRKNSDFCISDSHNLIACAWKFWNSNRGMELVDPMMGNSYSMDILTRCINVALLCVEESATDRPTISDVVSMLSSETATLPSPKHHPYSTGHVPMNSSSHTKEPNLRSINNLTITVLDGR